MTDKWDSCVLLVPTTSPILCREKGNYLFMWTKETDNTDWAISLSALYFSVNQCFLSQHGWEKKSNSGSVFYVPFMSITSIC